MDKASLEFENLQGSLIMSKSHCKLYFVVIHQRGSKHEASFF